MCIKYIQFCITDMLSYICIIAEDKLIKVLKSLVAIVGASSQIRKRYSFASWSSGRVFQSLTGSLAVQIRDPLSHSLAPITTRSRPLSLMSIMVPF